MDRVTAVSFLLILALVLCAGIVGSLWRSRRDRLAGASDITDRKLAEAALRESEERFRAMFENAAVGMVVTDVEGRLLDYNDRFCEFLGYSREELRESFRDALVPDEVEIDIEQQRLVASGLVPRFSRDKRYFRKDKTIVWGNVSTSVIQRNAAGKPARIMRIVQDISKRKLLEDTLRESEHRWQSLAETLPLLVFTAMADGAIEYLGTQATQYTGRTEQEMLGAGWAESIHPDDLERTGKSWFEAIEKQHIHEVQHRIRRSDGEYRWFTTRAAPARDSAGQVFKWVGTCTDITALKHLEEALQRTKDRLELAVRSSNLSIFEFEMSDGRLENSQHTLINFWEQLGYDPEGVPASFAQAAQLVMTPDGLAQVPSEMQAYLDGETPRFELEHQVRHQDGSLQWRLARGMAVRGEDGIAVRLIGSHVDITDRKQVEDKLRESEHRWRSLADTLPLLVFTAGADGLADYYNAQTLAYTGLSERELLGAAWPEAIHPDDREYTFKTWSASVERQSAHEVEHRIRRWDGEYRWFSTRAAAVRDSAGHVKWFGTCTDITSQKQLEAELRYAKELLELGIRGSNVAIFDFDMPDGRIENARQTMINVWETLGYDPTTVPSEFAPGAMLAIHPEDLPRVQREIGAYLASASQAFEAEYRVLHKDGSVLWRIARGTAFRETDGKPIRFIGSFFDITDIKRVEDKLRDSELRWRTLVETVPHLVFTTGPDGEVDHFSAQTLAFLGRPESELLGSAWAEAIHPEDREYIGKEWSKSIEQRRPHETQHRVRRSDGEYRWMTTRAIPLRDDTGHVLKWFGTSTDITTLKQLEAELRHANDLLELGVRGSKVSIFEFDMPDGELENAQQTMINLWESLGYDPATAPTRFGPGSELAIHPEDLERVRSEVNSYLNGARQDFEIEFRVRHKDGRVLWHLARGVAHRDAEGKPLRFIGSFVDITDKKQVEEQHRASEQHWRTLAETLPQLVWSATADGAADYFSIQTQEFTGLSQAELVGASWLAVIHPEDHAPTIEAWTAALQTGRLFNVDFRVRRADGVYRWFASRATPLWDRTGSVFKWVGTCTDIEDGKQLAEKLRESEQRWQRLAEMVPHFVWTAAADGMVDYYSAQATEYTGLPENELHGASWAQSLHPEDRENTVKAWLEALEQQRPYEVEHRIRRHDGAYHWFSTRAVPILDSSGCIVKWFGTETNVGSFKQLEAELRHARDLLELGVRGSKVSIFEFDMPEGNLDAANQTMINLWESLGYDPALAPSDFPTASVIAVHADDLGRLRTEIQLYLSGGRDVFEVEFRARHKDGSVIWYLARGVAFRDSEGKSLRFIGSFVDITDKKQIEQQLRANEQRWRSHAESLPQFVFTTTPDGSADYFSTTTSAYTGLSQSDLIGWAWGAAIHPDDLERTAQTWLENRTNRRPHQVEHRIRRADGVYRWFTTRAAAVWDSDGNIVAWFGTCTDIENLKQLETDLRHAKELLELGVRGSKVSIFEFDMPDGKIENARSTMINLWESLGYDPDLVPSDFRTGSALAIHPEDLERVRAEIQCYLAGEREDFEVEFRVRHKDGSLLWHLARGVAFHDSESKPIRFIGSFVDITDKKQIEQQLRESEHRWRQLAEMLPQIVWTTGPDGTSNYFSAWTTEYTGRSMSELIGWAWEAAIHPDDLEHTAKTWLENVASRRAHQVEHRIRRWDGEYRWFTTHGAAVSDSAGKLVGWFGITTDVENLKRLESDLRQAKDRLELAIRSANLCIWEYDMPDGRLETSRETLTNVWESFGYDVLDPPPSVASIIHAEDLPGVSAQIVACVSGENPAFESEHRVRHEDGTYHWILGRGVTLRDSDGRPTRFVGTSVDINDIKRIEVDLLRAREAAESANRAKDEFLANVSHEIRTPMNAILGMTELALDSARTEHQRQLLSTVRSAARNLLNIINDLLDFSKIAAGKLALDEADFSLRAALGDTVRALAPRAHRKGLELICQVHPDAPDALFGDAGRLRQVLMNLIGNALKFTAQGEVAVEVTPLPSVANADTILLRFTVRDTGIGIARDKQVAIFRAFEQEDASTTRKYGGTGLGLTISSQLVTLMGGEITVESELGLGSTFGFSARFARASRAEMRGLSASGELLENLRVLVIDDNETNRKVLVERLTEWRMRPAAVGDAASAVEALARAEESGANYSLILLDARMPDVDGITLATEIQARFGSSAHRLILLSSDDDPLLPARSREAGIRACLLKPVQHSELLETIWAVMNTQPDAPADAGTRTMRASRPTFGTRVALRILVAEDNELNVALLRELLTQGGHSAEFAGDGRAALAVALAGTFDLLLLDLHMPELDGFEVVRAIRERELTTQKHLPIIALTARSSNRDRERCLAAGMDDFLSKPIEADALWAAIDRIVLRFPPARTRQSRLLDHRAISRACAGRQSILDKLCEVFQRSLPDHMAKVRLALGERDLARLSVAAHLLYGTLAAFSTIAGALASTLEDLAIRQDVEGCTELVDRLEAMCSELVQDSRTLLLQDD